MPIPTVFIVGADKGGVGKTTVTRLLLDYFRAHGVDFKAYDTESPSGALHRFFPEKSEVVDLTKSLDQMKVFDNVGATQATVIDIRAGLLQKTLATLSEIGFLEAAKANKLRVVVLHVLGPSAQSLDEVKSVIAALNGSKHIAIANHINDTEYTAPAGALNIATLDVLACQDVDKHALPFAEYVNSQASFTLRGKVRNWMVRVFEQFDTAKLSDLSVAI